MIVLMTYELFYCTKADAGSLLIKNISDIKDIENINRAILNIEDLDIHSINLYKHITENASYYDSTSIIYHYDKNGGMFYSDNENIMLDEDSKKFIKKKLK